MFGTVCWWKFLSKTPCTLFKSSRWNLLQMIPIKTRCLLLYSSWGPTDLGVLELCPLLKKNIKYAYRETIVYTASSTFSVICFLFTNQKLVCIFGNMFKCVTPICINNKTGGVGHAWTSVCSWLNMSDIPLY